MTPITENIIEDSLLKNLDTLETELIAKLELYSAEARQEQFPNDKVWTNRLKKRLGDFGKKYNYEVCTSGFKNEFHSEWLYDMIWYKEEGEGELARLIEV